MLYFSMTPQCMLFIKKKKNSILFIKFHKLCILLLFLVLTALLKFLALTEKMIIYIKQEKNLSALNIKKKDVFTGIKTKLIVYFILCFCFLLLFWYYIACFCVVYKNTQIHLIKDFAFSFAVSLLYPFFIYFFPGIFRICALKSRKRKYMYKFSQILQAFLSLNNLIINF